MSPFLIHNIILSNYITQIFSTTDGLRFAFLHWNVNGFTIAMKNFRFKKNDKRQDEKNLQQNSKALEYFFCSMVGYLFLVLELRIHWLRFSSDMSRKSMLKQCALHAQYRSFLSIKRLVIPHQRESSYTAFLQVKIPDHFIFNFLRSALCSNSVRTSNRHSMLVWKWNAMRLFVCVLAYNFIWSIVYSICLVARA